MALDLLDQLLPHIRDSIYRQRLSLDDWKMKEGDIDGGASPSLRDKSWTPIRVPFQWGKYDKTFWFRQAVEVPTSFAGKPLALRLDFPDGLVFVNGKPYHGVDKHHQEIFLTVRARAMESFFVAVEAYSGRTKDLHTFGFAELVVVDATARKLYHALSALRELEKLLDHTSQEAKDIREIIRRTLIFLKYFAPGSEAYPEQIRRAYEELRKIITTEYRTTLPGMIHLIGHSHLDVVWLWTLKETMRKCGRTFSTALRLIEEYPDFAFSQSQAILYQFTRDHYPDLYKQIKQRVAEGRWEVMGSTWVEPDCNIPNGESLVRQIVYGQRFFKSEFNTDSTVLWLPDTFGYSWALPQILKKAGIKYFSTTKLTWNDTNTFPYSTFWWEGIDGTRILSHIPPVGLEGLSHPKDLLKTADALHTDNDMPAVLQTIGFGDGGGGVTKEQIEHIKALQDVTGLPPIKFSSVGEFFRAVEEQTVAELPVWKNELYLEKHRGTLTTHGWIKKANRQTEALLYAAELTSTLATLWGTGSARKYPQAELEALWKKLLLYQFHDIVPGTAIKDAYADVREGFEDVRVRGEKIIAKALTGLPAAAKKDAKAVRFTLFNPLQFPRAEYVELEIPLKTKNVRVTDSRGTVIEHQIITKAGNGLHVLCYVPNIPAFGTVQLFVNPSTERPPESDAWKASSASFETPLARMRLDGKGAFSSIYDKTTRRELILKGKRGNLFQTFRDVPKQWDAWDIDADFEKHRLELFSFKQARVVEQGPLRMTLRLEFRTENNSSIHQDVLFYHKRSRIDFVTHVKWHEKQTLLKVAFPFTAKSSQATFEIQFGALKRPTKSSDSWDKAKFEVPAQRWADLSESKYGIALLNDSKYAYDVKESVLRLTLLRSPHYPHPVEPWHLYENEITDAGEHQFVYALQPHSGDWRSGGVTQRAQELNHPVLVFSGASFSVPKPFLHTTKASIHVDTIKQADDGQGIIVRFHESHGDAADTTVHFGFEVKSAAECDLLEQPIKELKANKAKLPLKFKPFEIKTIRIVPKAKR